MMAGIRLHPEIDAATVEVISRLCGVHGHGDRPADCPPRDVGLSADLSITERRTIARLCGNHGHGDRPASHPQAGQLAAMNPG
jgi:hypothetical protein